MTENVSCADAENKMNALKKILNTGIVAAGLAGIVGCSYCEPQKPKDYYNVNPIPDYKCRIAETDGDIECDGKQDKIFAGYTAHKLLP